MLPFTENSGTNPKHSLLELLFHDVESFRRGDIP